VQKADARTLVTLLHLRDIEAKSGANRYSIVSEMLDVRNRELAEVTQADDFIVSENLTSLLVAQVTDPARVGGVTGLVGAAGGFGGFLPPLLMGYIYGQTDSYAIGLWALAVTAALTLVLTVTVVRRTAAGGRSIA